MDNNESKEKKENLEALASMMEDHPTIFYDTSELEGLDENVTQMTPEEWFEYLERLAQS